MPDPEPSTPPVPAAAVVVAPKASILIAGVSLDLTSPDAINAYKTLLSLLLPEIQTEAQNLLNDEPALLAWLSANNVTLGSMFQAAATAFVNNEIKSVLLAPVKTEADALLAVLVPKLEAAAASSEAVLLAAGKAYVTALLASWTAWISS